MWRPPPSADQRSPIGPTGKHFEFPQFRPDSDQSGQKSGDEEKCCCALEITDVRRCAQEAVTEKVPTRFVISALKALRAFIAKDGPGLLRVCVCVCVINSGTEEHFNKRT